MRSIGWDQTNVTRMKRKNLILHIEAAKTAVADADFQTVVEMHMIQVGQGIPVVSDKGNGRKIFLAGYKDDSEFPELR